jgi:hypothetical protein
MTRKLLGQLVLLIGRDLINRGNNTSGGELFSFRGLKKEQRMLDIEEAIEEKKSNTYIMRLLKVNERSMRRYRAKSHTKK